MLSVAAVEVMVDVLDVVVLVEADAVVVVDVVVVAVIA